MLRILSIFTTLIMLQGCATAVTLGLAGADLLQLKLASQATVLTIKEKSKFFAEKDRLLLEKEYENAKLLKTRIKNIIGNHSGGDAILAMLTSPELPLIKDEIVRLHRVISSVVIKNKHLFSYSERILLEDQWNRLNRLGKAYDSVISTNVGNSKLNVKEIANLAVMIYRILEK